MHSEKDDNMEKPEINVCWFRRDLRLEDHA